jgi:DUF4097 and DUF4098 domain-containing protein YvlB
MTTWEFPCSEPVDISISSWPSGSVAVAGEPTPAITVEVIPSRGGWVSDLLDEVTVGFEDGKLTITGPRHSGLGRRKALDLTVKAPAGSRCEARTASADVACVGEFGELVVQTASGDITAATVTGDANLRTASGDVMADRVGGAATVSTASGDVQLARVDGETTVNSASGDVRVGDCGPITVSTASGDVDVRALSAGNADLTSMSGDVRVGVTPGTGVYLDLATTTGDVRNGLDEADESEAQASIEIKCRTISGDIKVTKATGAAPQA